MSLSDRINRKEYRPCEACGSTDPRPVTHKTWCSVRILEPSLHRFAFAKALTPALGGTN